MEHHFTQQRLWCLYKSHLLFHYLVEDLAGYLSFLNIDFSYVILTHGIYMYHKQHQAIFFLVVLNSAVKDVYQCWPTFIIIKLVFLYTFGAAYCLNLLIAFYLHCKDFTGNLVNLQIIPKLTIWFVFQAALCRCSQPLSGFSARCLEDEQMLNCILRTNPNSSYMYVVDTRPRVNRVSFQYFFTWYSWIYLTIYIMLFFWQKNCCSRLML